MASNFFSNAETLNTRRQALTRDQQNRVRGRVVSPPINDSLAATIDTSGMARDIDSQVYEDIFARIRGNSPDRISTTGSFSDYPGYRDSLRGLLDRPGPTRSLFEQDVRTSRMMVELPPPEENPDTFTGVSIRANTDTLNIPGRWLYEAASTDPRGIGINLEEAIRANTVVGSRIRGFNENGAGNEWADGNVNIGTMIGRNGRNPRLNTESMNMRVDTHAVGGSSFKNQILETLKNDYELKMSSQKYGDRLEFKISLIHTESKEEILSTEDFIEMDE